MAWWMLLLNTLLEMRCSPTEREMVDKPRVQKGLLSWLIFICIREKENCYHFLTKQTPCCGASVQ